MLRCAEAVCSLRFQAAPLSACRAAAVLAANTRLHRHEQALPRSGMTTSCTNRCHSLPAELLLRRPWFIGTSDLDVLAKVFAALGTPTEAQWPDMRALPNFVEYSRTEAPPLGSIIKGVSLLLLGLRSALAASHGPVKLLGTGDCISTGVGTSWEPGTCWVNRNSIRLQALLSTLIRGQEL